MAQEHLADEQGEIVLRSAKRAPDKNEANPEIAHSLPRLRERWDDQDQLMLILAKEKRREIAEKGVVVGVVTELRWQRDRVDNIP